MPTFELNESFDSGLGGYTVIGNATLETVAPIDTAASLRCNGTGTGYLRRAAVAGQQELVVSFLYRHEQDPVGGAATIFAADTGAGVSFQLRVNTNHLQAIISGGTAVNGPTLVIGTTYLVDARFLCDTATWTIDWKVDGSSQTQMVFAEGAGSSFTFYRPGQINAAPNYNFVLDALRIGHVDAEYPYGTPGALPLQINVPQIASTLAPRKPTAHRAGLPIDVPRIESTLHPLKPETGHALPPPTQDGYTGPRGFMLRTQAEDMSTWAAQFPFATIVRCWIKWNSLQPSHGTFNWGGIVNSLKYCIDNDIYTAISISFGVDSPSWIYSANPTGIVERVHVFTDPGDPTGDDIPVPWDPNVRKHWQNVLDSLNTLLNTTYNGEKYGDRVAFVTDSMAITVGTEMTIGDAGDPRNTAAWNAIADQTQRRILYVQAWKDALYDIKTRTSCRPSVADGTAWGDGRKGVASLVDYVAATWPDSKGDVLVGPTDMRVDSPLARSYYDWTHSAGTSLLYVSSKHVTPWAQSAGNSYWNVSPFNIPTADAVKKAWLDNAVHIYRCVIVECQPEVVTKWGLKDWCRDVLQPAIWELAVPQTIAAPLIPSALHPLKPLPLSYHNPRDPNPPLLGPNTHVYGPTVGVGVGDIPESKSGVYFSNVYTQTELSSPG